MRAHASRVAFFRASSAVLLFFVIVAASVYFEYWPKCIGLFPNLILIAHSGSGEKAYFKNLNMLDNDSLIEYYYDHIKYTYKISNIYKVDKTGTVNIKRDREKKSITLITCCQNDKSKQLVFIGYIIDEIKY